MIDIGEIIKQIKQAETEAQKKASKSDADVSKVELETARKITALKMESAQKINEAIYLNINNNQTKSTTLQKPEIEKKKIDEATQYIISEFARRYVHE
ncbi:MAG: hypothetical protein FWE16_00285 [Firmicutes bacterium]|nr:hypothetical protein [Bacillota bacterium]